MSSPSSLDSSQCGAASEVEEALGVEFGMICWALAVPGNVSKTEGSCGRRRGSTATGDNWEAAVNGGDASNDDGACSGASIGTGAKLRNSRSDTRWSKAVSVRAIYCIRDVAMHTMTLSIRSLLIADMPDLPSPAALPDGDCPNSKSAETEDNVYKYLRQR